MAKEEEQRILDIKVRYQDAVDGILKYQKALQDLNAQQKALKRQTGLSAEQQREANRQMEANQSVITQYKENIRVLRKELQNNLRTEQQQEGSLKQLRAQLSNATKAYDELSRAERKSATGKEMRKHINEITDELKKAEEETQRFYRNVGNYEAAINNAVFGNSKFGLSLKGLSSMLSDGVSGAMEKAKDATGAFFKTVLGMVSNPYFLALGGVAGAGMAFKWFWDYNTNIGEATRLTKEFLGVSGDDLKALRSEIQATADTYGKEYKETLQTVDALVAQYGIDAKSALDIMNEGFAAGADENGNMLNLIQQYAPAFHDIGIQADELVSVIQQTRSGIFSEGGMALIQMAGKRIREMSTATKQSLQAVGIDADAMQKKLAGGQMSMFDAIRQISGKMTELGTNSQEVGELMRDVFGRQAVAGGAEMIKSLAEMTTSLDEVKKQTGEWGEVMDENRKANEELNASVAALFDVSGKGFEEMKIQMRTIATKFLTSIIKAVISVINFFVDWYNDSLMVRAAIHGIATEVKLLWSFLKLVFNVITDAVKGIARQLKGLAEIVEGIVTLSWDKIKSGFSTIGSNFGATWKEMLGDAKAWGAEAADNLVDGFENTLRGRVKRIEVPSFDAIAVNGDTGVNSGSNNGGGKGGSNGKKNETGGNSVKNNTTSTGDSAKKELEEIRKAEDLLNMLIEDGAEQQRANIKYAYDRQIGDLRKRLATEKDLTVSARKAINLQIEALTQIEAKKLSELDSNALQERIKNENAYYDELLKSVEKNSEQEYQLTLKKLANQEKLEMDAVERSKLTEELKRRQILAIQAAYNKQYEDAEIAHGEAVTKAKVDAIKKDFEERMAQKMNDYYKGDTTEDPELARLRLETEMRKQILDEAQQAEGETIEEFNLRKLGYENDFLKAKEEQDKKEVDVDKAKWDSINGHIGEAQKIAEAFGGSSKVMANASKMLALSQIAIDTGAALAAGIKQAQSVPFPGNIAAIATTVATILGNIATAKKMVKSVKFAEGGDVVGEGTGTSDSVNAKLSNGESVLTAAATSMFAPALSAFNQIGGGVPILGNNPNQQVGEEYLANAVARGVAMAPRPVVSVEEISKVSDRVEALERIGSV